MRVQVALKGTEVFDVLTAPRCESSDLRNHPPARSSLPHAVVLAGHYTFDVVDWGGSQWTGTITFTEDDIQTRNRESRRRVDTVHVVRCRCRRRRCMRATAAQRT